MKEDSIENKGLLDYLVTRIRKTLYSISEGELKTLYEHSQNPLLSQASLHSFREDQSHDCAAFYKRWTALRIAERDINLAQSAQLYRMASIFEAFPIMLKDTEDPSQKPRRNTKHIISRLQMHPNQVKQNNWISPTARFYDHFSSHLMPIIPFDASLRLFIQTIHEHPPPQNLQTNSIYPPNMFKDISTAIAGIPNIYTLPLPSSTKPPEQIPRTRYTPWSTYPYHRTHNQPHPQTTFLLPFAPPPSLYSLPRTQDMAQHSHWEPIHETTNIFP